MDQIITHLDGSKTGYNDYGGNGYAVIICHGGPGSRIISKNIVEQATLDGLRLIGIDRPGYGLSTLKPGREIADCSPDALAVVDALGIDQFLACGISTGGAYAFALAVYAGPTRCTGVVTGCAMTDMSWIPARTSMYINLGLEEIYNAKTREEAMKLGQKMIGPGIRDHKNAVERKTTGQKMEPIGIWDMMKIMQHGGTNPITGHSMEKNQMGWADIKSMWQRSKDPDSIQSGAARYANGVEAYVDDRIADGKGWHSFDIKKVVVPVTIVHGGKDTIVPVIAACHTKSLLPHADLRIFPECGHVSVMDLTIDACREMRLVVVNGGARKSKM